MWRFPDQQICLVNKEVWTLRVVENSLIFCCITPTKYWNSHFQQIGKLVDPLLLLLSLTSHFLALTLILRIGTNDMIDKLLIHATNDRFCRNWLNKSNRALIHNSPNSKIRTKPRITIEFRNITKTVNVVFNPGMWIDSYKFHRI